MKKETDVTSQSQNSYQHRVDELKADSAFQQIYEEEAAKSELWLQLVEARQAVGLTQQQVAERMGITQSQIACIEKREYDAYTLRTLRRYVEALGDDFSLQVTVLKGEETFDSHVAVGV
jgi:predicted XRE-type DNA-binding protein